MKDRSWKRWCEELIDNLEALHMLAIEADAYLSAFEAIYSDTAWPIGKDPDRRRALNRMSCFVELLNHKLDELLRELHEVIQLAMKR